MLSFLSFFLPLQQQQAMQQAIIWQQYLSKLIFYKQFFVCKLPQLWTGAGEKL